jgi:hypothetical protein
MSSYVDPIINAAVISQIDLRHHYAALLQLDFPEIYLPTFLHEGTHHACFMSPLGNTLAMLRMRGYRRTLQPPDDDYDVLEDVLRQEVTMEMLRPFAEGLACFAELDSIPGKSNVLTQPMIATFLNFGGSSSEFRSKTAISPRDINLSLFGLLYRARMSHILTRRRENVLAGRFSTKFGGHLAGYMSVKNLWARARAQSDAAADSELFSSFLRSYVYDDYALISHVLDFDVVEHNAANLIVHYFHERLKQLWVLDWERCLSEFERNFGRVERGGTPRAPIDHPQPGGIQVHPKANATGRQRLEALADELSGPYDPSSEKDIMRAIDTKRLKKRELFCLGSLSARVEVNKHRRGSVIPLDDDGKPASLPTVNVAVLDGIKEGTSTGSLEFYLVPVENARVSAIVRDHELVFAHFEGRISENRREQLSELFGTRADDLGLIREQEKALESFIASKSIRIVREHIKASIPQSTDKIYGWLATMGVDAAHWRNTVEMLNQGGFLKLCDEDTELVSGLAFLGVANSVCHNKAELLEAGNEQGFDVAEICRKAKEIEAKTGLPLILEHAESLFVLI